MELRTLNMASLVGMLIASGLWLGFVVSSNPLLLVLGAAAYLIGFTAFVAFAVGKIDEYLGSNGVMLSASDARIG